MTRTLNEIQAMLNGQDFIKQFISDLRGDVNTLGGDDQMTYDAIKSDSKLREEFARIIVADSENPRLIFLKEVKIAASSFPKEPFFAGKRPLLGKKNELVKFYFWSDDREKIMKEIPSVIPPLSISLRKDEFIKYARYSRYMNELMNPEPLSVSEFASVIHDVFLKQQRGAEILGQRESSKTPQWNLFPVRLSDGELVVIVVYWLTNQWHLGVNKIINDECHLFTVGSYIFSRC